MPSTKKYHNALKEIFESEKSYFNDLIFWQEFGKYLERNYRKYQFRLKVFSKVEEIVNFQRELLNNMDRNNLIYGFKTLEDYDNKTSIEYFSCFEKTLDKINVYQKYVENLPRAISSFQKELENSKIFSCIYQNYFSSKSNNKLDYMHYITLPIQKIARYGLLLGAIIKNEENEEYKLKYENVKLLIEENVKKCDILYSDAKMWYRIYELNEILELQPLININTSLNLINIDRKLIKEGFLSIEINNNEKLDYYVILLDNVFAICKFKEVEFKKLYVEKVLQFYKYKIIESDNKNTKTIVLENIIDNEKYTLYFSTVIMKNLWLKFISNLINSEGFYFCCRISMKLCYKIANTKQILQICCRNIQICRIYEDEMLFRHIKNDKETILSRILISLDESECQDLLERRDLVDNNDLKIIKNEFIHPRSTKFWYNLIYGENVFASALLIPKSKLETNEEFEIVSTESGVFTFFNGKYSCIINEKVDQINFDYKLQFLMVIKSNTIFLSTFTYGEFNVRLVPLLKGVSNFFYCTNLDEKFIVTLSASKPTDITLHFFLIEVTEKQLNLRIITKIYFSGAISDIKIIDGKFFVSSYDFTIIDLQNNRMIDLVNRSYFLDYNLKLTKEYFAMKIFKITKNYYLLCYSHFGFCVNKAGKYCESNVMMVWSEIPLDFEVKNDILLVFFDTKIQIFHIATGRVLFYEDIKGYEIIKGCKFFIKEGKDQIYKVKCNKDLNLCVNK